MKVKLTFIEPVLGTQSSSPEIHREFIASKSPDAKTVEEEVAAIGVDAVVQAGRTVFPKEKGKPFVYDYQIKGFFKDTCSALARVPETRSSKVKAFKKVIDGTIFVSPRKILFNGETGPDCQRPLRAQTAQGERIALANSETMCAGASLELEILCLDPKAESLVEEWLNYGRLRGIGQWRNSGMGRFIWGKL